MKSRLITLAAIILLLLSGRPSGAADLTPDELFQLSKVWTVELTVTPSQWDAMKPTHGPSGASFLVGPEGGRNGFLASEGLVFNWAHADLTIDGRKFTDIGVRDKGNGTYMEGSMRGKASMKLHLNRNVKGQKLAGLTAFNLANNITDAGWMNEELAYRLFRDAGVPAPRSSYARVYITIGESPRRYAGLYSLIEEVDTNFLQDRFGSKTGALLKPVPPSLFKWISDNWADYNQVYDPKTDLTPAQKDRFLEFCGIVTRATDKDFAAKLPDYIDLDNFARFLAVDVFLADFDGILNVGQNYYAYLDSATNKFRFIAWDHDHSFGQMGRASNAETENFSITHPWGGGNRFLERVFAVPAFRDLYMAKMREFSRTIFQPERLFKQVDDLAPAIRPAIAEQSTTAARTFDQVIADPFSSRQDMSGETLKRFVKARTPSVIRQLNGESPGATVDPHLR